ncbi:MAG: hypothetical protein JWQ13_1287, partial [Ramlibacter sp.]|nr:hypothetical protein [Ramlibacter sp.]
MNAPRGRSLALLALLVLLTLAGCNRNGGTTVDTASSAASAASAPAPAASAPAAAAPPLVPTDVPLVAAGAKDDPEPGRQLATSGAQGVAACAGCHGAAGEGNAQAGFPRLAGLGKQYLVHQLESYADGSRVNPIMQPIATAMTPAQRQASAVFYSLGAPAAATGATGASAPATAP